MISHLASRVLASLRAAFGSLVPLAAAVSALLAVGCGGGRLNDPQAHVERTADESGQPALLAYDGGFAPLIADDGTVMPSAASPRDVGAATRSGRYVSVDQANAYAATGAFRMWDMRVERRQPPLEPDLPLLVRAPTEDEGRQIVDALERAGSSLVWLVVPNAEAR